MDSTHSNTDHGITTLASLPRRQVIITLAGALLAMFLSSLDQTVVGTAMPQIIADLGGFSIYTWPTTAYIIASTITVPIVGKLTDMYGRRWFYIAGILVFTAGSILSGFSQTMEQLIAFRGIQGIGGGVIIANTFIVIGDLFPPAERGKYQGIVAGVFALSSVIGPFLGGYITDNISWQWVFFVNVPLGVLIAILFILFFPNVRPQHVEHRIDIKGVITLVLFVIPVMLALSWAGVDYAWSSPQIIGIFIFAAIMLVSFLYIETKQKEPIIALNIFKNHVVSVSMVVIFITGFGMFGGIIFIPLFFQGVLGMKATSSGVFLMPMMAGVVTGSLISGQLLSRMGGHYRIQGVFGLGIMATGMWLLSRWDIDTSYSTAVFNIAVTGFGLGVTMPLYVIAVQNAVPFSVIGAATSQTIFFRQMGGAIGLAIFNTIMNHRFASEFASHISNEAKLAISPEPFDSLSHNPQALMNAESKSNLLAAFQANSPDWESLFQNTWDSLLAALSSAIAFIFLIGMGLIIIAWITNFFISEIPLRKQHI